MRWRIERKVPPPLTLTSQARKLETELEENESAVVFDLKRHQLATIRHAFRAAGFGMRQRQEAVGIRVWKVAKPKK